MRGEDGLTFVGRTLSQERLEEGEEEEEEEEGWLAFLQTVWLVFGICVALLLLCTLLLLLWVLLLFVLCEVVWKILSFSFPLMLEEFTFGTRES